LVNRFYLLLKSESFVIVSLKAILCNWFFCLGVGAMVSKSVSGKTLAMWFPIFIFFVLVFEHAVVNMFLFPICMMLGANFTIMDCLTWNQLLRAMLNT
jgi:formate/nitrite transporter FocA (FNT family)